jgi:predicted DNA-binding transcriptional regulator YafY
MTHSDTEHLRILLSVFDEEQLIRFIYRLRKKGHADTALILALELGLREVADEPVETV